MDWDLDGALDIVVGDRDGNVHFFRRLSSGPVFLQEQPPVAVGERPIDAGLNSSPCVVDWNGDQLPDLVVGRLEGIPAGLLLFLNQGAPGEPVFLNTDTVTASEMPVQLYAAYPDCADLDGDGLFDLIVGNTTGKIPCYINTGTPEGPVFQEPLNLRADGEEIDFNSYVRPSVCDWNGDGIPDLLASGWDGTVHLYLGTEGTGTSGRGSREFEGIVISDWTNPVIGHLSPRVEITCGAEAVSRVHSPDGRLLLQVEHGPAGSGTRTLAVDVSALPVGVYIYTVSSGPHALSRSFVLLGN